MIRVLIADDQYLVRAGLAALIDSEEAFEVVAVASDGQEAVALAAAHRPDVACVDIRMPGRDGISVTQELSSPEHDLNIPVLILTTFDLDEYVFGALEAGASGFMLKDSPPEQITQALRQV
ncbi:MAG: response regulator transcription factor, partial [Brevibacterium sp.]|nr:response regulator transcription factor [Brevibacterium sp.]